MKFHRAVLVVVAIAMMAMTATAARAESLQELIERLSKVNGEAYMKPVADGLGADLNSGIYSTAKPHGIAGFDFGIKIMAAQVPDEGKFFTPVAPAGYHIDYLGGATGSPTAMGPEGTTAQVVEDGVGGATYDIPGGLDFDFVPLAVPQVAVGIPWKTDVIVRYLPSIEVSSEIGKVAFFGLGAKHSLSQYLPMVPVDLAAYFMFQNLDVGDLLEANNLAYGVCASKSLLMLTLYGGFGFESASMDVKYTLQGGTSGNPTGSDIPISLEFDSDATSRATIGARMTVFPLIFLQADASKVFGSDNVGTVLGAGLGVKLR